MAIYFYRITIRDIGAACTLRGRPDELVGVGESGKTSVLHPGTLAGSGLAGAAIRNAPANLDRQHSADVLLVTGVACQSAQKAASARSRPFNSLLLGLGGRRVPVVLAGGPEPTDTTITFPCGASMSGFRASFADR